MARHPPRVRSFSYRGCYQYLVTICTFRRSSYFSEPEEADRIAAQIQPFYTEHKFDVLAYCLMPDHVHLLLEGLADDADLLETIRVWKLRTGFSWRLRHELPLWQTSFHDRVLREGDDIRGVLRYVLNNPVRAGLVHRASEYAWTGSARHSFDELAEYSGDWSPSWK